MLMSPRKNVISFQLCSASFGQYAHPIAKPILMRLCISKSHGMYKGNKFYQIYIVFRFPNIIRSIHPKKKSKFFLPNFLISLNVSDFFSFFFWPSMGARGHPPRPPPNPSPRIQGHTERLRHSLLSLLHQKKKEIKHRDKKKFKQLIASVYATSQFTLLN